MTAVNITDYTAGDSLIIEATVRDSDGRLVDLTGASAQWAVAPVAFQVVGATLFTKSIGSGITVISTNGKLKLTAINTDITDDGEYVHSLTVTLANGEVHTPMHGKIRAAKRV